MMKQNKLFVLLNYKFCKNVVISNFKGNVSNNQNTCKSYSQNINKGAVITKCI